MVPFWLGVLVCSVCYNGTPQTGWLIKSKFISYSSGDWEVQDQAVNRFGVWKQPASWFTDDRLLTVSSHGREAQPGSSLGSVS